MCEVCGLSALIVTRGATWRRRQRLCRCRNQTRVRLSDRPLKTEAGAPANQSAIYKIEKGEPRRTISLDEAHALARVFELETIEDLEDIPAEKITARLAERVGRTDHIVRVLEDARRFVLVVLKDTAGAIEDSRPIVEYLGGGAAPTWPDRILESGADGPSTALDPEVGA